MLVCNVLALALGGFTTVPIDEPSRLLLKHHAEDIAYYLKLQEYNPIFPESWSVVHVEKQVVQGTNYKISVENEYTRDIRFCVEIYTDLMQKSYLKKVSMGSCGEKDLPVFSVSSAWR